MADTFMDWVTGLFGPQIPDLPTAADMGLGATRPRLPTCDSLGGVGVGRLPTGDSLGFGGGGGRLPAFDSLSPFGGSVGGRLYAPTSVAEQQQRNQPWIKEEEDRRKAQQQQQGQFAGAQVAPTVAGATGAGTGDADTFLRTAVPQAARALQAAGLPTELAPIMAGIAANETGYGRAVAGNNYFGIKGSHPQTGANTGPVGTWEVVNGQRVNTRDTFRAYASPTESFGDFIQFLRDNPRYAGALQQTDNPEGFIRAVHQAGYATDPNWSNQVLAIAQRAQGVPAYAGPSAGAAASPVAQGTMPLPGGRSAPVPTIANLTRGQPGQGQAPQAPQAGAPPAVGNPPAGPAQGFLAEAEKLLGVPYAWGGTTRSAVDCSGLVIVAAQAAGRPLQGRPTAQGIYNQTARVDASAVQPGDLVFFTGPGANRGETVGHVGIVTQQGVMLNAPTEGRNVEYANYNSAYWAPKIVGYGRLQ